MLLRSRTNDSFRRAANEAARAAPIAGMNTADMVSELYRKGFARRIDNWICRPDGLHTRPGFTRQAADLGVITALATHGDTVLPLTGGDWISCHVTNEGGLWTFAAAGVEAGPKVHNGTAWANVTIEGVDNGKIVSPICHLDRVFFIEKDTATIHFLEVDALSGPASPIYCGLFLKRGGSLVAIAGSGDKLYAVSDRGELVVFQGLDPTAVDSWDNAGQFVVPVPIGRRCFVPLASGFGLMTVHGLLPLPAVLNQEDSGKEVVAITRNIEPTIRAATPLNVFDSGAHDLLVIDLGDGVQLVRDPATKGWSRFVGLDATCWAETNGGLYFGSADGTLNKVDGFADTRAVDGELIPIASVLVDSHSPFSGRGLKTFNAIRPHFKLTHPYVPRIELAVDYRESPNAWATSRAAAKATWEWSEVSYDMMPAPWFKIESERLGSWRGIAGKGTVAGAVMGCLVQDTDAVFVGADYRFT